MPKESQIRFNLLCFESAKSISIVPLGSKFNSVTPTTMSESDTNNTHAQITIHQPDSFHPSLSRDEFDIDQFMGKWCVAFQRQASIAD
jgi:hypothetical protein